MAPLVECPVADTAMRQREVRSRITTTVVRVDRSKGHALRAGAFAMMPTGTRHFAWTKGETILQLHGTGPWGINYVNASEDPRKAK